MEELKEKLHEFDKTRSLTKAVNIWDWLLDNLDMPRVVKVRVIKTIGVKKAQRGEE
jgi:hypothetical protein